MRSMINAPLSAHTLEPRALEQNTSAHRDRRLGLKDTHWHTHNIAIERLSKRNTQRQELASAQHAFAKCGQGVGVDEYKWHGE